MSANATARSPADWLTAPPSLLDARLDDLERRVPRRPPIVELPTGSAEAAVVFGDSHGDWRSTQEVVRRYRDGRRLLVGLGDYIDRAPPDCGEGSVANALYLLSLVAESPDRVFLLQGNHETTRRIPVRPHDLPRESRVLWGDDRGRYDRVMALLERGPIAAYSPNGAYLAHAGFPRGVLPDPWTRAFGVEDERRLAEVVWAECDASHIRRGAAAPWGSADLDRFLEASGLGVFLRGHDPDLTGRPLYAGRCLTLHTCRVYERYGGVICARFPLERPLRSVADLVVEHLPTEGRTYPTGT